MGKFARHIGKSKTIIFEGDEIKLRALKGKDLDVVLALQDGGNKDAIINFILTILEEGQTDKQELEEMDIFKLISLMEAINEEFDIIDKKKLSLEKYQ